MLQEGKKGHILNTEYTFYIKQPQIQYQAHIINRIFTNTAFLVNSIHNKITKNKRKPSNFNRYLLN